MGEILWLSTKIVKLKAQKLGKLCSKYIGPYRVLKVMEDGNAYNLLVSQELRNIHPAFHISLLKPYCSSSKRRVSRSLPM